MSNERIVTLLNYKRWADRVTLQAIDDIDQTAHPHEYHLMHRLMNHIYVVDMIFQANITGQRHGYTALNTPETPTTEQLKQCMDASTAWYLNHVATMDEADFNQIISFTFVDGGAGKMRADEMLDHMLFHGTYHRGAVGWLIGQCGGTPPKDVLTVFLHQQAQDTNALSPDV